MAAAKADDDATVATTTSEEQHDEKEEAYVYISFLLIITIKNKTINLTYRHSLKTHLTITIVILAQA